MKAEGKCFEFQPESEIRHDFLEIFPYIGEKQKITYETKEFSAVCPFSGLPDIAYIKIEYIPDKSCLELKSLKYYFVSYRNVGIYQEAVTNRVFKDIKNMLQPKYLKITTIYNTRGGIDATCEIET
ncbi:MAG: preQ(1) synthase [Candidatus Margulisiibacteriota bacterium]